jgi:hypothetical protein
MNNRELKFRVYIPDHEKFSYFRLGEFDYSDRYLYQHQYPVQQYTGLKDSKGVEIYEGDILKYGDLYYEVMWVDYQWIATCPYYNHCHWPKFESFGREARASIVSGNIMQNPELIKK